MQIVEPIKQTLFPTANDLQYSHTAALWLLPSAFCLQTADSLPCEGWCFHEALGRLRNSVKSQHEGLEGSAREGSCLSSACQHSGLYTMACCEPGHCGIGELTCPEDNLVKKMNFLSHLTMFYCYK